MLDQLTFITTHLKDFGWIDVWIKRIRQNTAQSAIGEFLIIDQDRTTASRNQLMLLDHRVRVLQYPKSERHFIATGHDHGAVLNAVLHEVRSEHLCILDSDAHPISPVWLDKCSELLQSYDAILAQDPIRPTKSHPCFMLLKRRQIKFGLQFDAQLFEHGVDTGRLIGEQLISNGQNVYIAPAMRAFRGKNGSIYLNSIYHHGQGSFEGGTEILRSQTNWRTAFFREIVVNKGRYQFSLPEEIIYHVRAFPNYINVKSRSLFRSDKYIHRR